MLRTSVLLALAATLALVFASGCAAPAPTPFPAADVPGMAPPPYTAAEIRDHHPHGSSVVMLTTDGAGEMVTRQRTVFLEPDATGVRIELFNVDAKNASLGEAVNGGRGSWADLRAHAHFPAASTTLSHSEVSTPAGDFDCWCYTVVATLPDGAVQEMEFHFAVGEPGPPVLMVSRRDGLEVQRMTMVADERG